MKRDRRASVERPAVGSHAAPLIQSTTGLSQNSCEARRSSHTRGKNFEPGRFSEHHRFGATGAWVTGQHAFSRKPSGVGRIGLTITRGEVDMRFIAASMAFALLSGVVAVAQDVPKADVFLGYSFLRANSARNIPAFTNNGGLGTFAWNFSKHVAAEFEFGGYHNGNIHNIQFDTTEMTYLFGPRISLSRSRTVIPYIHTLFGGIHLTTSVPVTVVPTPTAPVGTTTRPAASQDAFGMALGGGLDLKVNHYLTLRPIQLDYLMTRLEDFGQSGQPSQNRNQHNLRYAAGIAFTFGAR